MLAAVVVSAIAGLLPTACGRGSEPLLG
jgi:hypothetical protein